jgi:hypothetical protein
MKTTISNVCLLIIFLIGFSNSFQNNDAQQFNSRFVGLWLIDQPYHALYEANLYRFNSDGSIELLNQRPSGYHTGTICSKSLDKSCTFGDQWYSQGPDTLYIRLNCSDSLPREATLLFPDSINSNCQNGDIWCGEPVSIFIQQDTSWHHCDFQWRWIKCIRNDASCMLPFVSGSRRPAFQQINNFRINKIIKTTLYTINGKEIKCSIEKNRNSIIIQKMDYADGHQEIHARYYR